MQEDASLPCPRCPSAAVTKDGSTPRGGRRCRCRSCGRRSTRRSTSASSRRVLAGDVSALAARWYVGYRLSYAEVGEWLAARGTLVDRSTIYRRARRLLPLFGGVARQYRRPVRPAWRVGES